MRRRNRVIKTSYRLTSSDRRDGHIVVDSGQMASKRRGSGSRLRLRVALRSTTTYLELCERATFRPALSAAPGLQLIEAQEPLAFYHFLYGTAGCDHVGSTGTARAPRRP